MHLSFKKTWEMAMGNSSICEGDDKCPCWICEVARAAEREITQARAEGMREAADIRHENERLQILIKMADILITNENAKEDWENAKRTRHM